MDAESDILIKKEHAENYMGFNLNPNLTGNHAILGEIQVYEVWWVGIIIHRQIEI